MTSLAKTAANILSARRVAPVLPIAWLLATAANAASEAGPVKITLNRLTHTNDYVSQIVAATNHTGYPIRTLKIQCAFFRNKSLLTIGRAFAENVDDGKTIYVEVVASTLAGYTASTVNRAACAVADTAWEE